MNTDQEPARPAGFDVSDAEVGPVLTSGYESVALLRATADHLRALQESIAGNVNGGGEHASTIKEATQLAQAIVSVAGELRAHEKLAIAQRDALRPEQVLEWFRAQPEERRIHLAREFAAAVGGGSVLA